MDTGLIDFMNVQGSGETKEESPVEALKKAYEPGKTGNDNIEWLDLLTEKIKDEATPLKPGTTREPFSLLDNLKEVKPGQPPIAPKKFGVGEGFGVIGGLLDTYKTYTGNQELDQGIKDGNLDEGVHGVHDLLEGSSGLLGNMDNNFGALCKSFNMGFSTGDAIAPSIFGTDKDNKNDSVKDKDGQYYAHTGNKSIDDMIDGEHEAVSNGDYAKGAKDFGWGALNATEGIVNTTLNPASLVTQVSADGALDLGKKALETEKTIFNPFGGLGQMAGKGIGDLIKGDD